MSRINIQDATRDELQQFIKLQQEKLKTSKEELSESRTHNGSLKEQILLHREEVEVLRSTVASLEDALATSKTLQEPVVTSGDLTQRLMDIQTTCDFLTVQCASEKEEHEELKVNHIALLAKFSQLQDDNGRLVRENEDLLVGTPTQQTYTYSPLRQDNIHSVCEERLAAVRATVAATQEEMAKKDVEVAEIIRLTQEKLSGQRKLMRSLHHGAKGASVPDTDKGLAEERRRLMLGFQDAAKERDVLKGRCQGLEEELAGSADALRRVMEGQCGEGGGYATSVDETAAVVEAWRQELRAALV